MMMTSKMIYCFQLFLVLIIRIHIEACDVLQTMTCHCYSSSNNQSEQLKCSNYYVPINGSIKLTNETLNSRRSFDTFHLTFHTREFNVSAMFINELSYLFARHDRERTIKITLTFQDYLQLNFEDYAFYQLFGEQSEQKTIFTLELTSNGKLTFAPMSFFQLHVDQLSIHVSSLEPYSFEELFNNTKIDLLNIEGCTPRTNSTLRHHFNGRVNSVKVTKMAELVSSEEFPSYPVRSLTIEAHESLKINASTFTSYHNLKGIHLIRPRFFFDNRSFDGFQYLPYLETLELDAETIKDNTFEPVRRIRTFTLGQNVRYLFENSLAHLDYLTRFDLSKVLLDLLYPSSKCILARYIEKQHRINPSMLIVPPQAEFCDCIYDFILHLVKKTPEPSYIDMCQSTQQERCQLSECDIVRGFRFPSKEKKETSPVIPSIDESLLDLRISFSPNENQQKPSVTTPIPINENPAVDWDVQSDEYGGSSFADTQVIILPPVQPSRSSSPRSQFLDSLSKTEEIDPNSIPQDDEGPSMSSNSAKIKSQAIKDTEEEKRRMKKNVNTLKWISLSLLCLTIVSVILVTTLIWFHSCRRPQTSKNPAGFERVPPINSNV